MQAEIRQGFHIRSMMKRVWACQIEILEQVDRICRKHNIAYFADWGTLLGAVREKGYISWDDDLDIGMTRRNYELFCQYAATELPEGYSLENSRFDMDEHTVKDVVVHIRDGESACTEPGFLKRHYGCPYVICIDLFVYDDIPDDPSEREVLLTLYTQIHKMTAVFGNDVIYKDCSEGEKSVIDGIESLLGFEIKRDKGIRQQLFLLLDYLSASYCAKGTKDIAVFGYLKSDPYRFIKREWVENIVYVPFEYSEIAIPTGYHDILTKWYGEDYMVPKQGLGADHSYPYYRSQEKRLKQAYEKRGEEMPKEFLE
ncbi:MAG: LicD family protein [Lachnospiraceae bacterium]|nr:LicD family protein [Lachnospiraceae bacterium]